MKLAHAHILIVVGSLLAGITLGLAPVALPGCSGNPKQDARTAVQIANGACVLLHSLDPAVEAICATEAELAPLFDRILSARRLAASHDGGVDAGVGDAAE